MLETAKKRKPSMNRRKSKQSSYKKPSLKQLITPLQYTLEDQPSWLATKTKYADNDQRGLLIGDIEGQQESTMLDQSEKVSEVVSNMFSKNKINSKNAFQVPIIDVSEMRLFWGADDGTWSKVSSTLQNSSKIYGYRVDSVSESIGKLTNSMSRSLQVENTKLVDEKSCTINNQINYSKEGSQYNEVDIEMHLEREKLKEQYVEIMSKVYGDVEGLKMRRMMDQSGTSALLLANVPIMSDLNIGISYEDQDKRNKHPYLENNINICLPNLKCSLQIAEQIKKITKGIWMKQEANQQEYDYSEPAIQQLLDRMQYETINGQIDEQVNDKYYNQTACLSIRDWQGQYQRLNMIKNDRKVRIKKSDEGRRTNNKGKQKSSKTKKTSQQNILSFEPDSRLVRENIFRPSKCRKQSIPEQVRESNLFHSLLSSFQISSNVSFQNFRFEQNQFKNSSLQNILQQVSQVTSLSIILDDLQPENFQRVPQIRETKQQLHQILKEMWGFVEQGNETNFSTLHKAHKKVNEDCIEAIDFLAILHLANQLGLMLKQIGNHDFTIVKV